MPHVALILAHRTDGGAEAVATDLERRLGSGSVWLLRPESLGLATWSHRIDARGRADTRIVIGSECVIESRTLRLVFNRIRWLRQASFQRASPKDRDYAGAELQALIVSWLGELAGRAVPGVRHRPWVVTPLPATQWIDAAAACGLPVAAWILPSSPRWGSTRPNPMRSGPVVPMPEPDELPSLAPRARVVVAGENAGGELAREFGSGCIATSRRLELPLLEFGFVRAGGRWRLQHVDPMPALDEPWSATLAAGFLSTVACGGRS